MDCTTSTGWRKWLPEARIEFLRTTGAWAKLQEYLRPLNELAGLGKRPGVTFPRSTLFHSQTRIFHGMTPGCVFPDRDPS